MALKINKMEMETPLHQNVLLAQIVELEGDCAKIITKFGFITSNRLSKLKKNNILFDNSKEITHPLMNNVLLKSSEKEK